MKKLSILISLACVIAFSLFVSCYQYEFKENDDNLTHLNVITFDLQYPIGANKSVNPTMVSQKERFEIGQKLTVDVIDYKTTYIYMESGKWVPEEHPVTFVGGRTYSMTMVLSCDYETGDITGGDSVDNIGDTEDSAEVADGQDGTLQQLIGHDTFNYYIPSIDSTYGITDITGFGHNNALFEIRLDGKVKTPAEGRKIVKAGASTAYNIPEGKSNWYQVIVSPRSRDVTLTIGGDSVVVPVENTSEGAFLPGVRYVMELTKENDELRLAYFHEDSWINIYGYFYPDLQD